MIPNISITDLLKFDNLNIIDIRSIEKYNNNHIPGSINIPFEKIITKPNEYLNYQNRYYIYCQKGITSKKICGILINTGYKVTNIIGGYEEWITKKE